jgi:nucleolysin TIA-1/TIAR
MQPDRSLYCSRVTSIWQWIMAQLSKASTFIIHFSMLIAVILQSKGFNYGFVEYDDPGAAERAMQTLNGRRVHQAVRVLLL